MAKNRAKAAGKGADAATESARQDEVQPELEAQEVPRRRGGFSFSFRY